MNGVRQSAIALGVEMSGRISHERRVYQCLHSSMLNYHVQQQMVELAGVWQPILEEMITNLEE